MQGSRAIIVLGMHRSGTSAVTRGLASLGVYLGDDLIDPLPDNPRGFWEDRSVLDICERVLTMRGISSVSVRFRAGDEGVTGPLENVAAHAAELLRRRFEAYSLWGFKNPRTARILPFWQNVLNRLGAADSYVIVNRNPLSVARSLQHRNGIDPVKSHLLWLQHMVAALVGTQGRPRVVVDYDDFMNDSRPQLERIAARLNLSEEFRSQRSAVDEYLGNFLTENLRHTQFSLAELEQDPAVPTFVKSLHAFVIQAARDELSIDSEELTSLVSTIAPALEAMDPIFGYLELREHELHVAGLQLAEQKNECYELSTTTEQQGTVREETAGALANACAALEHSEHVLAGTQRDLANAQQELLQSQEREGILTHRLQEVERALGGSLRELANRDDELSRLRTRGEGLASELSLAITALQQLRDQLDERTVSLGDMQKRLEIVEKTFARKIATEKDRRSSELATRARLEAKLRKRDRELTGLRNRRLVRIAVKLGNWLNRRSGESSVPPTSR